jgi:hypothetical protein
MQLIAAPKMITFFLMLVHMNLVATPLTNSALFAPQLTQAASSRQDIPSIVDTATPFCSEKNVPYC